MRRGTWSTRSCVVMAYLFVRRVLSYYVVEKRAKEHGDENRIEGKGEFISTLY